MEMKLYNTDMCNNLLPFPLLYKGGIALGILSNSRAREQTSGRGRGLLSHVQARGRALYSGKRELENVCSCPPRFSLQLKHQAV